MRPEYSDADLRRKQAAVAAIFLLLSGPFLLLSGSLCVVAMLLEPAELIAVMAPAIDVVDIIYNSVLVLMVLVAFGMVWLRHQTHRIVAQPDRGRNADDACGIRSDDAEGADLRDRTACDDT
jgi:hypothetical protein